MFFWSTGGVGCEVEEGCLPGASRKNRVPGLDKHRGRWHTTCSNSEMGFFLGEFVSSLKKNRVFDRVISRTLIPTVWDEPSPQVGGGATPPTSIRRGRKATGPPRKGGGSPGCRRSARADAAERWHRPAWAPGNPAFLLGDSRSLFDLSGQSRTLPIKARSSASPCCGGTRKALGPCQEVWRGTAELPKKGIRRRVTRPWCFWVPRPRRPPNSDSRKGKASTPRKTTGPSRIVPDRRVAERITPPPFGVAGNDRVLHRCGGTAHSLHRVPRTRFMELSLIGHSTMTGDPAFCCSWAAGRQVGVEARWTS